MHKKVFIILLFAFLCGEAMGQEQPLYESDVFSVYPRKVEEGQYHADIIADNALTSTLDGHKWLQQGKVGTQYPAFSCGVPISNTMYKMSVGEMMQQMEKDSTWRTALHATGISNRDLNYSILLSLGWMNPEVSKVSLMKKVKNGKIVQDDGTGGSWPVLTDRAVWVLGVWQVYLATGDKQWLKRCYEIARHSLMQDEATIYDAETGLVRGGSSFGEWRDGAYPTWMEPSDVAQTMSLSTNAIFYRANEIVSRMAQLCGDNTSATHFEQIAYKIKTGVNNYLWLDEKGYYGQYRYGRIYPIVSSRSEALGEALCVIFGIADNRRAQQMLKTVAMNPYGVSCYSPQESHVYPYQNNAMWPGVQAFWLWASAIAGNPQVVTHGIASIYRTAALYASNSENVDAVSGICIDGGDKYNMLWNVAGDISIVHRVLMGINMEEEGLTLRPFVPKSWSDSKQLTNFKYRKAVLDITVQGYGDKVSAMYVDGKRQSGTTLSASLTGRHTVRIVMNGEFGNYEILKAQPVEVAPETPEVYFEGEQKLAWRPVAGVKEYRILRNGKEVSVQPNKATGNAYMIPATRNYTEYQVVAVGENGTMSYASKPMACGKRGKELRYEMSQFAKVAGKGKYVEGERAVEITNTENTRIDIEVDAPVDGIYQVDFLYANGSGNVSEGNSCATRMLWSEGRRQGCVVFPQRGEGMWGEWGYSTPLRLHLKKGKQNLLLIYELENDNMSVKNENRALLSQIRLIQLQ